LSDVAHLKHLKHHKGQLQAALCASPDFVRSVDQQPQFPPEPVPSAKTLSTCKSGTTTINNSKQRGMTTRHDSFVIAFIWSPYDPHGVQFLVGCEPVRFELIAASMLADDILLSCFGFARADESLASTKKSRGKITCKLKLQTCVPG
jgi:hypothetical protein